MEGGVRGGDAAISFEELERARRELAQRIRRRLSPAEAPRTWLGTSADLAEVLAGSVLLCRSSEEQEFTMVVPPRAPSAPPVKRIKGVVSVRVSRSGAATATRYMEISALASVVERIVPGVLTMENTHGSMAATLRLRESGEHATLEAMESSGGRPRFVVSNNTGEVIGASERLDNIIGMLSVEATSWTTFTQGAEWGLPMVRVEEHSTPIQWAPQGDALSLAAEFGLPAVSSSADLTQFLVGCCDGTLASEADAAELSAAMSEDAPVAERAMLGGLLEKLRMATMASAAVIDSTRSRLRAIQASEDAPPPFCAFGTAWRQGAMEPPPATRRTHSRPESPALGGSAAQGRAQSPRPRQDRGQGDEVDAMTPNTLRQRLREALASGHTNNPGGAVPPTHPLPSHQMTPRCSGQTDQPVGTPQPALFRHSGQLGGLFGQPAPRPRSTTTPMLPAQLTLQTITAGTVAIPSIHAAMQTITPDGGPAIATEIIIPQAAYHMPVTAVVQALATHGMPEAVTQLAHAAGDSMPSVAGSVFEATSLLRHIEEVFVDVSEEMPAFNFLDTPMATNWHEAAAATQLLLARFASAFRNKRNRTQQPGGTASTLLATRADDKPPVGSYKQVSTATAAERAGACDAQLLEEMASSTVLRREHVRQSAFCEPTTTISARDGALAGELAHYCTTYGQAATAYILSNGAAQTALSGYGVPMALAAIRLHLLARATKLVHATVGFERALSMHTKCSGLALSFLTGLVVVEDCVTILGGSPPHEEAELRREGGATTAGTLGTTSGPNAQLSIREAFALWGGGLHAVIGSLPGIQTNGVDFAVGIQLKKIPRELEDAKLLSICRYMTSRLGVIISSHRTVRGAPLPDVAAIVAKATTDVFRERDQDQRAEERATVIAAPLLARIEKLEAMGTSVRKTSTTFTSPTSAGNKRLAGAANTTYSSRGGATTTRAAGRGYARRSPPPQSDETASTTEPSAQERTQNFLASLSAPGPSALRTPRHPTTTEKSVTWAAGGDGPVNSRRQALLELAAIYRQHVGMDPKGDPSLEPCAYKALVGSCTHEGCRRCASGLQYPEHLLKGVKERCAPSVFDRAPKSMHTTTSKKPSGGR